MVGGSKRRMTVTDSLRLKYNRQWGSVCPPRARMKYPCKSCPRTLSARTAFRSSVSSARQTCAARIRIPGTFLRMLHSDSIDVRHRRTFTPTNLKAVTGDATSDHSRVDPLVENLIHVTPPWSPGLGIICSHLCDTWLSPSHTRPSTYVRTSPRFGITTT